MTRMGSKKIKDQDFIYFIKLKKILQLKFFTSLSRVASCDGEQEQRMQPVRRGATTCYSLLRWGKSIGATSIRNLSYVVHAVLYPLSSWSSFIVGRG